MSGDRSPQGSYAPSLPKKLEMRGWKGNCEALNGCYELAAQQLAKDRPCWVYRDGDRDGDYVIFHTGKSRWVVSKKSELDGSCCFAFLEDKDRRSSPDQVKGVFWQRCFDDDGKWGADPKLEVVRVGGPDPPFLALLQKLEMEMRELRIASQVDRQKMWQMLDENGDGEADLQEVEHLVGKLVKSGFWPRWLNHEIPLEVAFRMTNEESLDGDGKVEQKEFHDLLTNIFWCCYVYRYFRAMQASGRADKEIGQGDFKVLARRILEHQDPEGVNREEGVIEDKELDALWNQRQEALHGTRGIRAECRAATSSSLSADPMTFETFCRLMKGKVKFEKDDGRTTHDALKVQCHNQLRLNAGKPRAGAASPGRSPRSKAQESEPGDPNPTRGVLVKKKAWADFNALEKKIQSLVSQPNGKNTGLTKLWKELDFNGNHRASLSEVDKWVVEKYPLLNHKPALMRAVQATKGGDYGADYIEKKTFKALLTNLFYYNKLFWIFDEADEGKDRRLDFKEFHFMLTMCGLKMSKTEAQAEFDEVNDHRADHILFTVFCKWFINKKCPQGLTDFVKDE